MIVDDSSYASSRPMRLAVAAIKALAWAPYESRLHIAPSNQARVIVQVSQALVGVTLDLFVFTNEGLSMLDQREVQYHHRGFLSIAQCQLCKTIFFEGKGIIPDI